MRRQPIYALDDIDVRVGHCPDVDVFKCDFERDFCGWTQNTTITTGTSPERRQWRRYSGRAAFYSSQPKQDHT